MNPPGPDLRDYFAARAMASLIACAPNHGDIPYPMAAVDAYRYADAMLKARSGNGNKDVPVAPEKQSAYPPLANFPFNVRSHNCLKAEGIHTVEQLELLTDRQLLNIPNMGRASVTDIRNTLAQLRAGKLAWWFDDKRSFSDPKHAEEGAPV
jgi:Bacterial RNA polymerase, alpha chain C terminal domain